MQDCGENKFSSSCDLHVPMFGVLGSNCTFRTWSTLMCVDLRECLQGANGELGFVYQFGLFFLFFLVCLLLFCLGLLFVCLFSLLLGLIKNFFFN